MGFLSGRVTYERFAVSGPEISLFNQEHVDTIDRFAVGKVGAVTADGVEVGFTGGEHLLDLDFTLEKNIINDALHFGMRIDSNKIPGDLLKAYTALELATLAAENPSGHPNRQQRLQAKENAQQQCEAESKTGKFRKMKQFPILWDARNNLVYFGATNANAIDRFVGLFKEAFGRTLTRISSGSLAHEKASSRGQSRAVEDLAPSVFTGPNRSVTIQWVANQFGSRDFLGNEFLLWLWWVLDTQSDTITLPDQSQATCMIHKTLTLECPDGETGKETISSEAPAKLPEAKRALLAGKLPRKAGLIVVRHDEQYDLTLQAETLSVGSASLPKYEGDPGRPELEDRVDRLRHLSDTIDLLFDAFCRRRLGSQWVDELRQIRDWLKEAD